MSVNVSNYQTIHAKLLAQHVSLIAVSKTKPNTDLMELYALGQRAFGENYVQELVDKAASLPHDIQWHFIGHLQSNKVKYIAPFVHLIHGVDSEKLLQEMNKHFRKERKKAMQSEGTSGLVLESLFTRSNMTKMFRSWNLQKHFDKAMQTGDFSTTGYSKRAGYCQQLKRLSMLDAIGHMRRISTNPDKNNEEIVENRKYDPKQVGHLCLLETPDTNAVGQILQLAIGASSSLFASPVPLYKALEELSNKVGLQLIGKLQISSIIPIEGIACHHQTKVFVNGLWHAVVTNPNVLFTELNTRKCTGQLHVHTSIVFDYARNELRINTESGRTVRPILRIDNQTNKIMLSKLHLDLLTS